MHARHDILRTIAIGTTLLTACDPARLGTLPSEQESGESGSGTDASAGDAGPGSTADDAGGGEAEATSAADPTDGGGEAEATTAADPTAGGSTGDGQPQCDEGSICDPQPDYFSQARVTVDDAVLFGLDATSYTRLDTPCTVDAADVDGTENATVTLICEGLGDTTALRLDGVPAEVFAAFTIGRELLLDIAVEQTDQFDDQSRFVRVRDFVDGSIVLAYGLGQRQALELRLFPLIGDARDEGWYGVSLSEDDSVCAPEPLECENITLDTCADPASVQRLGVRFDDAVTVVDAGEAQYGDLQLEVASALRTTTSPECPRSVVEVLVAQR